MDHEMSIYRRTLRAQLQAWRDHITELLERKPHTWRNKHAEKAQAEARKHAGATKEEA